MSSGPMSRINVVAGASGTVSSSPKKVIIGIRSR
jgi:hypothetical protein